MKKILSFTWLFLTILACNNTQKSTTEVQATMTSTLPTQIQEKPSKADLIIEKAIEAHGGDLYNNADYSFTFRKKEYRFINKGNEYTYSVKQKNNGNQTCDFITNGKFERFVNEEPIDLSQKHIDAGMGALNSVIYFATLPHKLKDSAVIKKFIETTNIKDASYHVIEVTFNQQGGGKDHDDEFHYWINKQTNKIDYLAYNYSVNKGGVRFRSFYNRRVIDGITFQDYINWKAPTGTPLKNLPALFEQGKLDELSRIETENVINTKNK
ncbi:DUF6503 family protein [Aquimarina agarilytica]|uniref:DUF6503 family protein n=1 Tax=Aquimarina agarilytica TaxID=1087449 RepID=UPI00028975C0|nr:DUF6503 family protein [Aquimarina agarilytica]